MKKIFIYTLFSLVLLSCARVGSPVGGKKDTIPPKMMGYNLDSSRVNVPRNLKELRIDFDEYITLDKISKNLIISPPIKKIKKILPTNLANKYILIQWSDTLQANTTYNFNFGNSIRDNNEGNSLRYFNFAFSTGEKIDDQYISGVVENMMPIKETSSATKTSGDEKSVVVGLYKANDTINYKEKPYYITVADKDGYYELNYLSPGKYKMIAFEDENGNGVFDTGKENVGFFKDDIALNKASISGKNIKIYPSVFPFKYLESKENPGGILMQFQGNPQKIEIQSVKEELKDFKLSHHSFSDSAFIWFDAKKNNVGITESKNLKFSYTSGDKKDTASVFFRFNPKNEMIITNKKGNLLAPKSNFVFSSNYIVNQINPEKWKLVSDSVSIPFTAKISQDNPFSIEVNSDFKEGKKYSLTVPKESVSSYYDQVSKSYRFDFQADKSENYGSLTLKLKNSPTAKFWIQLIDVNNKVVYSRFTTENIIKFDVVKPDSYTARILVDNNGNGFWDAANLFTGTFAEDIFLFSKKITARPLWEVIEDWDLNAPPEKDTEKSNGQSKSIDNPNKKPETEKKP